jgi:uncharacterized YigZ family protein
MLGVKTSSMAEDVIKNSRFIGYMMPCSSMDDVQTAMNRLSAEHPAATHIAFAFRIKTETGTFFRYSDAGEPGGTAGKPIFQHIEGRNIINCLIAVVRYFGGIKLGTGGLTRAYGNTARKAIEKNVLVPLIEYRRIPLIIDYPQLREIEYHIKNWGGTIESRTFKDRIELIVNLPEPSMADLNTLIQSKKF